MRWIVPAVALCIVVLVNRALGGSWTVALATILGPWAGAFARDWQSCCAGFSSSLFWISGPLLLVGIGVQFVPIGRLAHWERRLKDWAWSLGWVAWFGASWVSYLHAVE